MQRVQTSPYPHAVFSAGLHVRRPSNP
jgi:hypothetical protein